MPLLIDQLHTSLNVTPLDDNQVRVEVTLPSDLFNDYQSLLESLTGFINAINHQKHLRQLKEDADYTAKAQKAKRDYYRRIVKDYDGYQVQDLTRSESIKRISQSLKADNHPWHSPDLVRRSLIDAGRPGRTAARRKKS